MNKPTESKRRYFDISNRITRKELKSGLVFIYPFIMARRYERPRNGVLNWMNVPFWLEFKASGLPDDSDFNSQPLIPRAQELNSCDSLPEIEIIPGNVLTHKAVAERIPDGDVAVMRVGKGCLWTMIPEF